MLVKKLRKKVYESVSYAYHHSPTVPRDIVIMAGSMCAASYVSGILLEHTGAENNSALVFVLAVALTSFLTTGYLYGIIASVVGAFLTNFFFMAPYAAFSLSRAGYPVAMLSMLAISILICALTARVKRQKEEAIRREQNTKRLYELNEKLNQEKAVIQFRSERETMRSNILRAVSHDLRTPLTTISGSASVLLSSAEIAPQNVPLLQDIKNEADSLIIMVENLLSVTRIQEGTIPLKTREEALEEVVGDAILTTHRRFTEAKIDLQLSEDLMILGMEPVLIKQVVVNLLENAIRHSGDRERIEIALSRQEDWAVIEIRDHGKGLPAEVLEAVWENRPVPRDLTGDSTRGMGIGLSVCQSIVKAHDGHFEAKNCDDGGAMFRILLPMSDERKDETIWLTNE